MAGGSALALHLGHRQSVDFDFFINTAFSSADISENLKKMGEFETQTAISGTLLGNFNGIKFSLLYYNYPLIFPTHKFLDIEIADPKDIGAMKIAAVMDRGTKKDFIDLFFLSKNGISIDQCLENYEKKYKTSGNNLYSIITSLSYFVDAENSEMPVMFEKVSWNEIKFFFEKEAVRLGKIFLHEES